MAKGQSRPRTPNGGGESRSGKKICFSLRVRVRVPPSAPSYLDTTLPRLGSRVRIPSPAPNFLEEINGLKRSSGAASCFPAPLVETGEAWGSDRKKIVAGVRPLLAYVGLRCHKPGHSRQRRRAAGQNLRSRWLRVLPEMTIALSIHFPGCFRSFFAKDTDIIVWLVHQGSPSA